MGDVSSEEIALFGPSWAAMTPAQRAAYGPDHIPSTFTVDDAAELLALAVDFPKTIRVEGIVAVAEKWARTEGAVCLAREIAAPEITVSVTPAPILGQRATRAPRSLLVLR